MPVEPGSADPEELRAQLKVLKRALKDFEHDFQERTGRKPEKQDIATDKKMAASYKVYSRLKAQLDNLPDGVPVSTTTASLPVPSVVQSGPTDNDATAANKKIAHSTHFTGKTKTVPEQVPLAPIAAPTTVVAIAASNVSDVPPLEFEPESSIPAERKRSHSKTPKKRESAKAKETATQDAAVAAEQRLASPAEAIDTEAEVAENGTPKLRSKHVSPTKKRAISESPEKKKAPPSNTLALIPTITTHSHSASVPAPSPSSGDLLSPETPPLALKTARRTSPSTQIISTTGPGGTKPSTAVAPFFFSDQLPANFKVRSKTAPPVTGPSESAQSDAPITINQIQVASTVAPQTQSSHDHPLALSQLSTLLKDTLRESVSSRPGTAQATDSPLDEFMSRRKQIVKLSTPKMEHTPSPSTDPTPAVTTPVIRQSLREKDLTGPEQTKESESEPASKKKHASRRRHTPSEDPASAPTPDVPPLPTLASQPAAAEPASPEARDPPKVVIPPAPLDVSMSPTAVPVDPLLAQGPLTGATLVPAVGSPVETSPAPEPAAAGSPAEPVKTSNGSLSSSQDPAEKGATSDAGKADIVAPAAANTGAKSDRDAVQSLVKQANPVVNPVVFRRLMPDTILRCKVIRKKSVLDKNHPTYLLYNETDSNFLLAGKKRKTTKSVTFTISNDINDCDNEGTHYLAKLRANFQRTQFLLYDARSYSKTALGKGLKELACVSYSKTVLPRELQAAIPNVETEDFPLLSPKDITQEIKRKTNFNLGVKEGNEKAAEALFFLKSKAPKWNDVTQTHCLNFGGRVTQPSIKNFQLIGEKDESYIIMQFGRTGPDQFSLDVRHPLTPLAAFAIALTTFDAYDSV